MSDTSKPSIAELQRGHRKNEWYPDLVNAAPVLLEIAAAAVAWSDAKCETESPDTDDYTIADMNGECAGDTHHESCPVAQKRQALINAIAKVCP